MYDESEGPLTQVQINMIVLTFSIHDSLVVFKLDIVMYVAQHAYPEISTDEI